MKIASNSMPSINNEQVLWIEFELVFPSILVIAMNASDIKHTHDHADNSPVFLRQ